MTRLSRLLLLPLLALALLLPQGAQAAQNYRLERVVILMRHGIRPPTKAAVTPPGIAAQPWVVFSTPYGELTPHGFAAVKLLAAWDRRGYAGAGLLPRAGCPAAGAVVLWSDTDQRTIRTGDAMLEGMFPGCGLTNGHLPQGQTDPLFSPLEEPGGLDPDKARAAVLSNGSLANVTAAYRAEFELLGKVLGRPGLADLTSDYDGGDGRPRLKGLLDWSPTAAQVLMLQYVEGLPMSEVGWGRASRKDIETLMRLHVLKGRLLQRPLYLAGHGAAPLANRMLEALAASDGPALTVLVGHDTNIVDLSGLLDIHWKAGGYPADTPPPGSGLGLELLRGPDGKAYVRAFFRSQTMDQMRYLTPLEGMARPTRQRVKIPGCSVGRDDSLCTLETFRTLLRDRLTKAGVDAAS